MRNRICIIFAMMCFVLNVSAQNPDTKPETSTKDVCETTVIVTATVNGFQHGGLGGAVLGAVVGAAAAGPLCSTAFLQGGGSGKKTKLDATIESK